MFSEAMGFTLDTHVSCTRLELIDSVPEPIGQNTDVAHVEAPKVVLHCPGVKDELHCADRTTCWELWVVQA